MTRNTIVIEYVAQRAPRALHLLEGVLNTVGAIMFALLTWAIAPFVYKAWVTGDYYGYLAIFTFPVWPIKALILIGSAATALQYAIEAISAFHTAADPDFDDGSSKEREFERDAYE